MMEQKLEKGTSEWKKKCGEKNKGNGHAVRTGMYVKKPKICSESCKLSTKGCPYFESCNGKECIRNIKEKERIENINEFLKNFIEKRVNANMIDMEIGESLLREIDVIDYSDIRNSELHIINLLEKLKKIKESKN